MGQRNTYGCRRFFGAGMIGLVIAVLIALGLADSNNANDTIAPDAATNAAMQYTQPAEIDEVVSADPWNPSDYDYALSYDVHPEALMHLTSTCPDGVIKNVECVVQSVDANGITCVEPGGNYVHLATTGNPGDTINVSFFLVFS